MNDQVSAKGGAALPIPASQRLIAAMVLFVANLMVVLDTSVANVSVPHISGNLGATLDQGSWVITSYAVAEAICIPLSGWLARRFGEVRVFLVVLAGFTMFSFLCGMSVSLPMLVICRVGQGFCGGPVMPLVQTLITRVFPQEQVPKAYGLYMLTVMIGPALGPVVGGLISEQTSWHWIFLVNVPIGIVCLAVGLRLLKPLETPIRAVPIDKIGMILLVIWVGSLQLMLDLGRDRDWFADTLIVVLGILAVVGLAAFVIWELTEAHPAVNVRLLRSPVFSQLLLAISLSYAAYFSGTVALPQWLQSTMGYDAVQAGLLMAAAPLGSVISSQIALRLLLRFDARGFVWFGSMWAAASYFLRLMWSTDADTFDLAWLIFFQGIGMPVLMISLSNMALSAIPEEDQAGGAGLFAFTRTMAIASGTALVLTVWGNQQAATRSALVDTLNPGQSLAALAQQGLTGSAAYAYITGIVDRQANTVALLHTNALAAVAMLVTGWTIWLLPRIELTRLKGKDRSGGH